MSIDETQQQLPVGWQCATLGDICDFSYGASLPSHQRSEGSVPVYGSNGIVGTHAEAYTKGPTIIIGRKGSIGEVHFSPGACWPIDTTYYIEHPKLETDLPWLVYCLRSLDLRQLNKAAAVPGLNRDDAAALPISLPPLPEQRRIAAILTEKMTSVEKARTAAEERLKAAKELPAAYLREVFESEEAQKWPRKQLGDLATVVQNGIYKSAEHYGHGQPFVRMYNVPNTHWKLNLHTLAQVSLDDSEKEKFVLQKDDILVSRVNSFELVGKCAWVGVEAEGYAFENMLIRVRLGDQEDPKFIAQQFGTNQVRQQIEKVAKRAIGQASINSEDLRGIELILPPTEVQQRLSMMVDEKSCAVANIITSIESELESIKELPAALLRQALAGGL